jgi:hypothetical protein
MFGNKGGRMSHIVEILWWVMGILGLVGVYMMGGPSHFGAIIVLAIILITSIIVL